MSQSNCRIAEPKTLHHLTSRMAHRVFFLKEDQRNDFMGMMLRVSHFTGIQLIGWCIMENHFHILAYLPIAPVLTDEEVISRYQALCGTLGFDIGRYEFSRWKTEGEAGAYKTAQAVSRIRCRMYSIAWFMKIIKQWFTEEYNRREGHKGTLWEAVYHDRVISNPYSQSARDCLAYINLNPIRAAITPDFDAYRWSSLHDASFWAKQVRPSVPDFGETGQTVRAKTCGQLAMEGLRFVYGEEESPAERMTDDEILAAHRMRMSELLEHIKLERAEEIARKRAAGMPERTDALTDEAMVAQARVSVDRMQRAVLDLHAEREMAVRPSERRELLVREIRAILQANPGIEAGEVAALVGKPMRTVYRFLALAKAG